MRKNRRWLGTRAKKIKAAAPADVVKGHPPRLVFHTEGIDRPCPGQSHNFDWLVRFTFSPAIYYSAYWCPDCGKIIQAIPFDKAARSLKSGNLDGRGTSPNRWGVTIQVCVVGYGNRRFTDSRMKNADVWGQVADSWGIPHRIRRNWTTNRSAELWKKAGVHGHCHSPAPGENHWDPGRIDPKKLKKALWPKEAK